MELENLDPERARQAVEFDTPEKLLEFAKEEGYELSDEQLESIAGGGFWEMSEEDKELMKNVTCPSCGRMADHRYYNTFYCRNGHKWPVKE